MKNDDNATIAEEAVLSALICFPSENYIENVSKILTETDFADVYHRAIYKAILEHRFLGKPIELPALAATLRNKQAMEVAVRLLDVAITGETATYYARQVWEASRIRKLKDLFHRLSLDPDNPVLWDSIVQMKLPTLIAEDHNAITILYRCMSDIEPKPIRWVWPGIIARGKLTLFAGNPGTCKTQVTISIAATITTGGLWPVDGSRSEIGNVIFVSAEDDPEDTIRPRLDAACADLSRVFILDAINDKQGKNRTFNLKTDISHLETMINKIGNVAMVVVDPISAYLGGTDSHRNPEIITLLHPLKQLAEKYDIAVLSVTHCSKSGGSQALLGVMGSLAFVALPRSVWLIVKDAADPERRFMLPLKNNIGNDQSGFAFRVESRTTGGIETSCVTWENEPVSITADEAVNQSTEPEQSAVKETCDFLSALLSQGAMPASQVFDEAKSAGHSAASVNRAKTALGIKPKKDGNKGHWLWQLPSPPPKMLNSAEDAQSNFLSTFEQDEHLPEDAGLPELTEDDLKEVGWL